jgi:hypothetical protein
MKPETNKLRVEKLTIEITGKPITPHIKVFADGKSIGNLNSLKIVSDPDELVVDIQMTRTKVVDINGKKETVKEPIILKWSRGVAL